MQQNTGCCPNSQPFPIWLGDAGSIPMKLIQGGNGNPFPLNNCSEIVANIPNADGTFTQLKLSLSQVSIVSPPDLGMLTVIFTSVQSALFNVGEGQNVDVTFTINGNPRTIRFQNAISVFEVD